MPDAYERFGHDEVAAVADSSPQLVCEIPEARNGKGATWLPTPRLTNQSTPTSPLLLSSHLLPARSDANGHDEEGGDDDEEQSVTATSPFLFSRDI